MNFVSDQYLRLQAVALAVVLLGGCATGQPQKRQLELSSMNLNAASRIAAATPGSILSIPVDEGAAPIEGTVGETYYAASNRECKRFVPLDMKGQTERVVCRHASGIWYMQRALPVRSTEVQAQPLPSQRNAPSLIQVPAADATVDEFLEITPQTEINNTVAAESVEAAVTSTTQVFSVEGGETLLKFSERVTGSRGNWLKIARLNSMEDPYTLFVGMPLQVPAELVKIN